MSSPAATEIAQRSGEMHGVGIAFRREFAAQVIRELPSLDCFELVADSFLASPHLIPPLRAAKPVLMHSVNLSLGTSVDEEYLGHMAEIARLSRTAWWSDHLCYTRADDIRVGHFLPIPFTDETLDRVTANVRHVQQVLGVPLAIENVSADFRWPIDTMSEQEFLKELVERTGAWILLDVENLRINAANHDFRAEEYLDAIPLDRVLHVHLAGGESDGVEVDTHSQPVPEETWRLFGLVCQRARPKAVILERDQNLPPLEELLAEMGRARAILAEASA